MMILFGKSVQDTFGFWLYYYTHLLVHCYIYIYIIYLCSSILLLDLFCGLFLVLFCLCLGVCSDKEKGEGCMIEKGAVGLVD